MSLTKDTVPVDVEAVLFWVVWDAEKAALEVEDYSAAITWAAQTSKGALIFAKHGQADLSGADLIDADLHGAYLAEATLQLARYNILTQ